MKRKIADMDDVIARIKQLEAIQERQLEEIKVSFREMGETLSPKNLIKGALRSIVSSPGLRTTAIDTAISASAGLLGRKLITRGSGNILRKVAGTAVQFILSNFVRNKMPKIKENIAVRANGTAH
jgi:hypothetical protein